MKETTSGERKGLDCLLAIVGFVLAYVLSDVIAAMTLILVLDNNRAEGAGFFFAFTLGLIPGLIAAIIDLVIYSDLVRRSNDIAVNRYLWPFLIALAITCLISFLLTVGVIVMSFPSADLKFL